MTNSACSSIGSLSRTVYAAVAEASVTQRPLAAFPAGTTTVLSGITGCPVPPGR